MQHLAAPIRKEIDEAHGNYIWLDIGVPSFRNLWHISMKRRIVILLLAVTSIPLHFLQVAIKMGIGIRTDPHGHRYNSTIIPTLAVNSFAYALVDQSFLEGGPWNASETAQAQLSQAVSSRNLTWMLQSWHDLDLQSTIRSMQVNANSNTQYTRMDPLECILAYNRLLGNHSDFIMVSTTASESDNSLLAYGMSVSGTWDVGYSLCSGGEQFDCGRLENLPSHEQVEAVRDWNIGGYKIDSCLSSQRSTKNLCSVEYSFQMMSNPEDGPLLTVGDAICSFLKVPDTSTRGLGIVTKRQISGDDRIWRAQEPRKYQYEQPRWLRAVSLRRWALCLGL
ncbi:MAG: hypothetical protein LQ350_007467 [Teloschistes chrysophthalmus]|nr:MAG: hypothetical protein LQ350_007467 [Niorma chrysophthalma]